MTLRKKDPHRPPDDALWFLPLGGCGEIGMNLNLYGTCGKWLMVDCGVTFPDEMTPGIEIITPDISFIEARKADLVGMVITHGHEDHHGAIEYLWPRLRCPIYATPFTAGMIRGKLAQAHIDGQARIVELPAKDGAFELGPFKGEMIHVTHSVPETQMLLLRTPHGNVLHTGDWKFDPEPMLGALTDEERLQALGDQALLALVGDSTGALESGFRGSEADVLKTFRALFGRYAGRIVVTCFSSHIARMKTIAQVAHEQGRYVALAGRSIWRNAEIAQACGYLPEYSRFLSEHEAMEAPRDKIVIVCTGCQGQPRSALVRMATFDHPEIELDKGDTVIFSSREIPGNEKAIARLQNLLVHQGVQVVTAAQEAVHVSGHASQGDMARLYQWTRPRLAVPVHGELRHQTAHAELAVREGVAATIVPANGDLIRLGPGLCEKVAQVKAGRHGLDGKVLRELGESAAIKDRRKMNYNGAVVLSLVLDRRGQVAQDPQVTLMGVEEDRNAQVLRQALAAEALDVVAMMPKSSRLDDAAVRHALAHALRRYLKENHGKKPMIETHVFRV